MRIQELNFKKNNMKIAGELYLPDEGKECYPTVIIGHAFGCNYQRNMKYAVALAEEGFASYIFDFCGGGVGSKSDGTMLEMSVLTEVDDMKAVLEQVKEQPWADTDRIFLMGESQGGCVAALAAPDCAKEIRGLVLLYPALVVEEDTRKRCPDPENIPDEMQIFRYVVGRRYNEDALRLNIYENIGKYEEAVLIIHGDADEIVPLSYSERAADTYQNAKLVVLPGAGHGFEGEDVKRTVKEILEYLRQRMV